MSLKWITAVVAAGVGWTLLSNVSPAEETWYRSPTLAIMTGFIKEPLKPYTIEAWEQGLGRRMDADRWVADFKEAGATYLIFYDKWIDGFVFHDTKTTGFKTRRDFVRDVADACHRGDLRLVLYFNALSDGNPEFDEWAVRDRDGRPIVFSPRWPTRMQTLHSPFREISIEQVRELMTGYGRIDGVWLDIFGERLNTSSPWVAQGYEKMFEAPFGEATVGQLAEFSARTLAGYLDQVQPMARQHQPDCVWTANGSARRMLDSGIWAKWVGSRLDYGSNEGHQFDRIDELARLGWVNPRPTEIGLLLNRSWFTPMEDEPPPAAKTPRQAIAEAAVGVCQGASVYMALTPGHAGRFGEDLQVAKAVGKWFRSVEPFLKDARPYADVGIVLGAPAPDGPGLAPTNSLWKHYEAAQKTTWDEVAGISDALTREGIFSRILYAWKDAGSWPQSLDGYPAVILPERAPLDDDRAAQLRQYVQRGGRLIAFGHASLLDCRLGRRSDYALADVFGARYRGEVAFPNDAYRKASARVDSEYGLDYSGRYLLDDGPTHWSSADTPMPHWAEITLASPVEAARIELVSRQGPYLVTDFDVQAHNGKDWELLHSVRGATTRRVSVPLESPVRTDRIRVTVLAELYQGEPRRLADVEAIRIFDASGRNWARDRGQPIPLREKAPRIESAFAEKPISFLPMVAQIEPTTAEVVARMDGPRGAPAILCNRYGDGEAMLFATGEASFQNDASFWAGVRRLAAGKPTLSCSEPDRYRILLTQAGGAHVLHVIDRTTDGPRHEPAEVTISLETERLGGVREAVSLEHKAALPMRQENGRTTLVVRPDPVASIALHPEGPG